MLNGMKLHDDVKEQMASTEPGIKGKYCQDQQDMESEC